MTEGDSLDRAILRFSSAMETLRAGFNEPGEPTLAKTQKLQDLLKDYEDAESEYKKELRLRGFGSAPTSS